MFAVISSYSSNPTALHLPFIPSNPSPLSDRDPNSFQPVSPSFKFPKMSSRHTTPSASRKPLNTLAKINRKGSADHRREVFQQKVKQNRDDTRYEARGEQAMRREFFEERQSWETKLREAAPATEEDDNDNVEMDEVEYPEMDVAESKRASTNYDDTDYEQLFAEILAEEENVSVQQISETHQQRGEESRGNQLDEMLNSAPRMGGKTENNEMDMTGG